MELTLEQLYILLECVQAKRSKFLSDNLTVKTKRDFEKMKLTDDEFMKTEPVHDILHRELMDRDRENYINYINDRSLRKFQKYDEDFE